MGKNLNQSSMEKLFSGLTKTDTAVAPVSVPEEEKPTPKENKTARASAKDQDKGKSNNIRFCSLVDATYYEKVKTIATNEGVAIKDILNLALSFVIGKYEEQHGEVRIKKHKKGDVDEIFNL